MKKFKYLLFFILLIPVFVFASSGDKINRIDVTIALDTNGNAHVVEVWDAYAGSGSEFYKAEYNLGNMEISNFKVVDENNNEYTFVSNWNIDATLSEKSYKNGFYYSDEGLELCWGKTTYGRHKYTISYDVSNFVFNTNDAQVIYWQIINKMEMLPDEFSAVITGPTSFEDTLDVWGYGYKGYAYVNNGKIYMSNEEKTDLESDNYAVLLVKFPLGTFNIAANNTYSKFSTFEDVFNIAEEGKFNYDYKKIIEVIRNILYFIFPFLIVLIAFLLNKKNSKYKFGKAGSKINMKEINNIREIPCDKNLYKAFFLAQAYNLNSRNTDFFGSIFLKWLFEDKIQVGDKTKKGILGKDKAETTITLNANATFDNEIEKELYSILLLASKDGILEKNELLSWSKVNYGTLFSWFDKAEKYGCSYYISENKVTKKADTYKEQYFISDTLKPEAIELSGLKKFLLEFSRIKEKSAIEVKLWKEYLMFAQIFGIADKVAEQFKNLYPEVLTQMNDTVDMTDIVFINSLSRASIASASSARSAAQNYSSGGGGFSFGGGGGGSFGGGGGGGR